MLMDIFMFLITFFVIMLAFACGVSYMFNYLKQSDFEAGSATGGVFTYFFWVLLQPFRGNPDYDTVADLPYDTSCLTKMTENRQEVHIKSITKCRMETMYDTSCMLNKMANSTKLSTDALSSCIISRKEGENFISKSVVPMWVVYQFFVSVVLLRQVFLTSCSFLDKKQILTTFVRIIVKILHRK